MIMRVIAPRVRKVRRIRKVTIRPIFFSKFLMKYLKYFGVSLITGIITSFFSIRWLSIARLPLFSYLFLR